ncbi:MAG: hypothetical protein RLZZ292_1033, partial [Bacteroidota bacterium]
TIAGSPGWSVTGGPWVEPKDGMKKYVWTETTIKGGQSFSGKLPQPSDVAGVFQNVKVESGGIMGGYIGTVPIFYQDAAVIAYRVPSNDKSLRSLNPIVTSSSGAFTLNALTDGDLTNTQFLPPLKAGEEIWVQYAFETPTTIKSFSVSGANHTAMETFSGGPKNRTFQASDDGIHFKTIAEITNSIVPHNTVAIPPTTAKYFRLVFKTLESEPNVFAIMAGMPPETPTPMGVDIAEFNLFTSERIDQFEDKAGFTPWKEKEGISEDVSASSDFINTEDIVDLTSKMKADGSLDWTPPAPPFGGQGGQGQGGNWNIIRFGYSLTGRQNHPASPEATGLEVDKLDKEAVKKYINTYLDMYKDATGGMMGAKGLQYMILDSYEAGHMNWTKTFPEEFLKRRGYDLKKWLPVLTGRVLKNTEASEKFLWDFRKTIGELIAENHYDIIGEELHKRGMKRYTESHEDKRIYLADGMDVKRNADIPMSAMWTPGSLAGGADEEVRSEADIRESASVAHIYGKPIIAAESMTSMGRPFQEHPERLKRTADLEMASGLNRFVIHTSVHQPLDDKKPGFSLGPFGQYFTRQETWGEQAKPWINYLARSCYLLQQGKAVTDVLYFYGENTNITWQFREKLPNIAGYEYDFCNSSALINIIQAKNGKLVTPSGMSYSVLVLDESAKKMTLSVLKKIREFAKAGITIRGIKPEASPSLSDDSTEFQNIVNEVWGRLNPNVSSVQPVSEFLANTLAPDVTFSKVANPTKILYVHRSEIPTVSSAKSNPKSEIADIYWLDNRSDNENSAEVSFRVSDKIPELWNAQTGKSEKVSYKIEKGRTIIPLHFDSWEAYFIIFKEKTSVLSYKKPVSAAKQLLTIDTPWSITFQEGKNTTVEKLASWSENADPNIKYFSGTAHYKNTFKLKAIDKKTRYEIDLGDVKNIAEVVINGKSLGTVWKKPFKLDISEGVKKGINNIEINVTNVWANRLIGDAQPDTKNKTTFTTMPFYQANSPLLPSGMMGPVVLWGK